MPRSQFMKMDQAYRIVGITNSAPSLIPDGHLLVTVLVLV